MTKPFEVKSLGAGGDERRKTWRSNPRRRSEEAPRFFHLESGQLSCLEKGGDAIGAFDQRGAFRRALRRKPEADMNGACEPVLERLVVQSDRGLERADQ